MLHKFTYDFTVVVFVSTLTLLNFRVAVRNYVDLSCINSSVRCRRRVSHYSFWLSHLPNLLFKRDDHK